MLWPLITENVHQRKEEIWDKKSQISNQTSKKNTTTFATTTTTTSTTSLHHQEANTREVRLNIFLFLSLCISIFNIFVALRNADVWRPHPQIYNNVS